MRLDRRTTLEIGQEAPAVEVTSVEGEALSLPGDFRGKYLLLDFGAPSDLKSRFQIARVNGLHAKYVAGDRLAIISLLLDEDDAEAREFLAAKGQPWPQAIVGPLSNPVASAYGIEDQTVPRMVLIDPEGKVQLSDFEGREIDKVLAEALTP